MAKAGFGRGTPTRAERDAAVFSARQERGAKAGRPDTAQGQTWAVAAQPPRWATNAGAHAWPPGQVLEASWARHRLGASSPERTGARK